MLTKKEVSVPKEKTESSISWIQIQIRNLNIFKMIKQMRKSLISKSLDPKEKMQ